MKVLKHEWFPKVRNLIDFSDSQGLKPEDIAYVTKNPDGTWEMLYFAKDDGHK